MNVALAFWAIHVAAIVGVASLGWSWSGFGLAVALYLGRMFFVTAGYHRYFAHRSFRTSRWFQFVLAVGGSSAAQKGVLWWAAHHRNHHRYSDRPGDVHSPIVDGFWRSHLGWLLDPKNAATDQKMVADLMKYPELRWIDRHHLLPAVALGAILLGAGGVHAVVWGLFVSTVMTWHITFSINSLAHLWGTRRYPTADRSRNNGLLALLTLGEGWHNNHHHHMRSCRQGFRWYEIDVSYAILRLLAAFGVVWDIYVAPAAIVYPASLAAIVGAAPLAIALPPGPVGGLHDGVVAVRHATAQLDQRGGLDLPDALPGQGK